MVSLVFYGFKDAIKHVFFLDHEYIKNPKLQTPHS
jgi:hypothetical protein